MYSLTKATQIFLQHYNIWSKNVSEEVLKYNSHKVRHSIWVLEVWRNILTKMKEKKNIYNSDYKNIYNSDYENITLELRNKAEIIFYLHDLWRFYQNDKVNVLSAKEFDHWTFWYKLAKQYFEDNICLAIKYHDKYDINWLYEEESYKIMSEEDKKETVFLAKVIRDADKLQNMIYMVFDIESMSRLCTKNIWDITENAINEFRNWVCVNRNNIKSNGDHLLSMMAWIFDINFEETKEILNFYNFFGVVLKNIENMNWITKEKIEEVEKILKEKKLIF